MTENEHVDIAPTFSFKPIDSDSDGASSLTRDEDEDDEGSLMEAGPGLPSDIFRATRPYLDKQQDDEAMMDEAFRVISPYPFSHASREEITEREQLGCALSWTLASQHNDVRANMLPSKTTNTAIHIDYNCFLGLDGGVGATDADAVMEECDDFSVSIQDADTWSRDLGLEDPASFWEDGASMIPTLIFIQRTSSPTEISLGTAANDDAVSLTLSVS